MPVRFGDIKLDDEQAKDQVDYDDRDREVERSLASETGGGSETHEEAMLRKEGSADGRTYKRANAEANLRLQSLPHQQRTDHNVAHDLAYAI